MLRGILSTGWSAGRMFHVTAAMLASAQLLHPEPGAVKWVASDPSVLTVTGNTVALVDANWCGVTHVVGIGQRARCVVTIKVVPDTAPPLSSYATALHPLKCYTGAARNGQPTFVRPFVGYGANVGVGDPRHQLQITWMRDYAPVAEFDDPVSPWSAPVGRAVTYSSSIIVGGYRLMMTTAFPATFHLVKALTTGSQDFAIASMTPAILNATHVTVDVVSPGSWAVLAIDKWGVWYHQPSHYRVIS